MKGPLVLGCGVVKSDPSSERDPLTARAQTELGNKLSYLFQKLSVGAHLSKKKDSRIDL
jgi:hypothetical protein